MPTLSTVFTIAATTTISTCRTESLRLTCTSQGQIILLKAGIAVKLGPAYVLEGILALSLLCGRNLGYYRILSYSPYTYILLHETLHFCIIPTLCLFAALPKGMVLFGVAEFFLGHGPEHARILFELRIVPLE